MPLVNMNAMLLGAQNGGYAVGGFNFNDFEDAKGIMLAAQALCSPVILMASLGTVRYMGAKAAAYMVRALVEDSGVPAALHLDHATDYDVICQCVRAGFSSVMIDASKLPLRENIALSRRVAEFAHEYGCSVEAELGRIAGVEEHVVVSEAGSAMTAPSDVPEFVEKTGVDALAVSVGTAHGFYKSQPKLDFDRIKKIRSLCPVPLVLHGGTGVPESDIRRAIACGMSKVNIATEMKYAYTSAVREFAKTMGDELDPRKYMVAVIESCKAMVEGKMQIFGSAGHAK